MEDWKPYQLYSLAEWINGMAFRDINFSSKGLPVIKIAEIKNGLSGQTKYTEDKYDLKYFVENGDMLFCWSGQPETSIGTYWWRSNEGWLNQHIFKVLPKEEIVRKDYFYYILQALNPRFVQIARNKQTTGLGHVTKKDLENIEVRIPEFDEQKAIAKILSSLDDKIELNRQMNATLEAMARALFKAWFVDFEPVRANMENRPSESASPEIAKLFPCEFENDIPKGWRIGTLNDISFNHRQNVNPTEVETETAYVGLEHIPRKSLALTDWGKSDKAESTKSSFKTNDILFGKLRPYFHKVVVSPIDGICSTDILVIRPKQDFHFGQTLITFSSDEIIQYADRLSNGAKMPRTSWSDLAKFEIVIPSKQVSEEFSKFASSMAEKIKLNIRENKKLAEIRDSLLPRLISGKIRVGEAEKILEKEAI
jgi:type I restriction enzyme S subunit